MPEAAGSAPATGAGDAGAAPATATGAGDAGAANDEPRAVAADELGGPAVQSGHRFYYGLGIGVQTLLWFLLFLAIVVAVAVGGELTEFRYVGF